MCARSKSFALWHETPAVMLYGYVEKCIWCGLKCTILTLLEPQTCTGWLSQQMKSRQLCMEEIQVQSDCELVGITADPAINSAWYIDQLFFFFNVDQHFESLGKKTLFSWAQSLGMVRCGCLFGTIYTMGKSNPSVEKQIVVWWNRHSKINGYELTRIPAKNGGCSIKQFVECRGSTNLCLAVDVYHKLC